MNTLRDLAYLVVPEWQTKLVQLIKRVLNKGIGKGKCADMSHLSKKLFLFIRISFIWVQKGCQQKLL
jgi:hypothetical protein